MRQKEKFRKSIIIFCARRIDDNDNVDDECAKCKYCGNTFASKKRKFGRKPGAHSLNLMSENSAWQ